MRPFYSKDGRLIVPHDHTAYFGGRNNRSKGMVLIWLLHHKGQFRTARQLADETGVNYDYLRARLSFWFNIRYVNRKVVLPRRGRPVWSYCIAERGEHFVENRIPVEKRNEYISDINLWRLVNAR
jgi:predicted ArsR family transcriptional regulator